VHTSEEAGWEKKTEPKSDSEAGDETLSVDINENNAELFEARHFYYSKANPDYKKKQRSTERRTVGFAVNFVMVR